MSGNPLDASELVKNNATRSFWQPGGPGEKRYFFGVDTQYHYIDGAEMQGGGDIEPIYVPDPVNPNKWRLADKTVSTPDLPTISLVFNEKWGTIPRILMGQQCEFNVYEVHGKCADLSDFYRSWIGYVLVYSGFKVTGNIDLGTRTARDADDMLEDSVDATGSVIYPVGSMAFGEEASTDVVTAVIDGVYGPETGCADCGAANDGARVAYVITRANVGSPGAPGQLLYTLDGGTTWKTALVTGIGTAEPVFVDVAGSVLFVGAGSNLFYTVLNKETGAPTSWNSVTLPATMTDVYVKNSREIYFTASGGRIFKTEQITVAPTLIATAGNAANLNRIKGVEDTIVAVGANGTIYKSINAGNTWSLTTFNVDGVNITDAVTAVDLLSSRKFFVGTAGGEVFLTKNGGATWERAATPFSGQGAVKDISVSTREVIWVSQTVAGAARLLTTLDGGATWASDLDTVRILNFPTIAEANRVITPRTSNHAVNANYLLIAGTAIGGTDGVLIAAAPNVQ